MTIRAAPAASGVNTLWLSTLTTTTKVRKNAPIASTAYLRISVVHGDAAATATDSCWLVMTSAICFLLEYRVPYSTIARLRFAGILASGRLSPRLTELAKFWLAATALTTRFVDTEMECVEKRNCVGPMA